MNKPEITSASVFWNASINAFATFLTMVLRFFLPPIILGYLSLSEYGLWSYCFILIGYIGMSLFGFSSVYVKYFATYSAHKQTNKINELASTGIICLSVFSIVIAGLTYLFYPWLFAKLPINESLQKPAFYLIFGTTVIFLFDITTNVFGYLLQGLQQFNLDRLIFLVANLAEFISIFVFLYLGFWIYSLMIAFGIRILVSLILGYYNCKRLIPDLNISFSQFNKEPLKLIWNYGGIIQISGLLTVFNNSIEKVFAGLFLGPAATALYEIGEKFPTTIITLPASASWVLLPTSAHLEATNEIKKLKKFYLHSCRWVNIVSSMAMGFFAPFASQILLAWLGVNQKYQPAAAILSTFTIAYQIRVVTSPASAIFRGINKPLKEMWFGILEMIFVLVAALFVFPFFGVSILTINFVVASMMIAASFTYLYLTNIYFDISQSDFFGFVLAPGLVSYGIGYALEWLTHERFAEVATDRFQTLSFVCVAFIMYLAIVIPLVFGLLCEKEERQKIKDLIFQMFRKK